MLVPGASPASAARTFTNRGADGGAAQPLRRPAAERGVPKVGRNDPCPCGSGKKYKKCHGGAG
jgi:preprotein translocase subunit SecA